MTDVNGEMRHTVTPEQSAALAIFQRLIARLPRGRGRIARFLAGKLRRSFVADVPPFDLGLRLCVDPTDVFQLEIWLGTYQPHVVNFLMRSVRPGDTVLCAGLHVGYVAAIARRLAGPTGLVLSAEPDPVALERANNNLELGDASRDAKVEVLTGGLSDSDECLPLHQSSVLGHSSFASSHHEKGLTQARLRRGDSWLGERGVAKIDVMVLDVEGWELRALRGLENTLGRSPALVALIELSRWALEDARASPAEVVALLRDRGFGVRWAAAHGRSLLHGVWGSDVGTGDEGVANDILCLGPSAPR